jgi:hypothetical protein
MMSVWTYAHMLQYISSRVEGHHLPDTDLRAQAGTNPCVYRGGHSLALLPSLPPLAVVTADTLRTPARACHSGNLSSLAGTQVARRQRRRSSIHTVRGAIPYAVVPVVFPCVLAARNRRLAVALEAPISGRAIFVAVAVALAFSAPRFKKPQSHVGTRPHGSSRAPASIYHLSHCSHCSRRLALMYPYALYAPLLALRTTCGISHCWTRAKLAGSKMSISSSRSRPVRESQPNGACGATWSSGKRAAVHR